MEKISFRKFCVLFSAIAILIHLSSANSRAGDALVMRAKSLTAKQVDQTLPAQPIAEWLRAHVPAEYEIVWGEHMTDCGESTGNASDAQRDMPLCAEVEIRKGTELAGYLALFVGTRQQGLFKDKAELYFGYLEHHGRKYDITNLSDLLHIE